MAAGEVITLHYILKRWSLYKTSESLIETMKVKARSRNVRQWDMQRKSKDDFLHDRLAPPTDCGHRQASQLACSLWYSRQTNPCVISSMDIADLLTRWFLASHVATIFLKWMKILFVYMAGIVK